MRQTSAELLEYPALKELLARYISSPGGRRLLDRMTPSAIREELEELLAEAGEAMDYLAAASQPQPATRGSLLRPRFANLPDLEPLLAKLRIEGAVLEPLEIRQMLDYLDRASDLRAMLTVSGRFPRLGERALRIGEFRGLLADLSGKVQPDGSIADNASVALNRLRRDIERQQRNIRESLDKFLRTHRDDGILQEEFVTIRNDRFVVPVVSGQKRKVDGVIHAASGTGHTLFVEPFATIELNNDLVRLREQETREVFRILQEMSVRLRQAWEPIAATAAEMAALEFIFAKGAFGGDFGCTIPRFSPVDAPRLNLEQARHPLLEDVFRRQKGQVVPLDLTLTASVRTLLISGPNTGGKTVALKTVGLFALMAQSGLPVPSARAELPVFQSVLADLGDHQSIEQSLSSFSSHVARVRDVLTDVTAESLVLLDELGRATDPDEGGALAVAILDHVRVWNPMVLASTHLLAPKIYGATTGGVLNAAMSFDEATLAPTYHLRTGAPGASAGLSIAERLGIPQHVIEAARSRLSSQQQDLTRLLNLLEQRLKEVSEREAELRAQRDALSAEQAGLAKLWERRESQKLAELERRAEELMELFQDRAGRMIEDTLKAAEQRKAAEHAQRRVSQVKREWHEGLQEILRPPAAGTAPPPKVREGSRVRLQGVGRPARVRRILGPDRLEVEAGFAKLQVLLSDVLEVLPDSPEPAKLPANLSFRGADHAPASLREINVIGMRAEEACDAVDRFLDQAALASVTQVRIVHGHGMGILKKAIATLLRQCPHVLKFAEAPQSEGGAGATIADLKVD